jgi:hypothetical protein
MSRDDDPAGDYYSGRDAGDRRDDPGGSASGRTGSGWFDDGDPGAAPGSSEGAEEHRQRRNDPRWDTFKVSGDRLLETVKRIVREGNARRIVIRNDEDRALLEFPLTAGVVGAALLPMWAAVGAVAALVGNCSIEVERRE